MGIVKFATNPHSRIAIVGLMFVAFFECLRVKGAIIMSIILATFVGTFE